MITAAAVPAWEEPAEGLPRRWRLWGGGTEPRSSGRQWRRAQRRQVGKDPEEGAARDGQGSGRRRLVEPERCLAERREDSPAGQAWPRRAVIHFQSGDVLGPAAVTSSFDASLLRRRPPTTWLSLVGSAQRHKEVSAEPVDVTCPARWPRVQLSWVRR